MRATSPTARVPMVQVITPLSTTQLPWELLTAATVTPAGTGSVSTIPVASDGPLLARVNAQVSGWPAKMVAGPLLLSVRSASGVTAASADPALSAGSGSGVDEVTVAVLARPVPLYPGSTVIGTEMVTVPFP